MPDERSHPLLQQTALAVNPFIDLPKPPTLPPNYTTIPFSTLPPSILTTSSSASTSTNPSAHSRTNSHSQEQKPAYVTTSSGTFAAHPSTIITQNRNLLEQIRRQGEEGRKEVEEWESTIKERELAERRRKAPGWLDREERILMPERRGESGSGGGGGKSLLDDGEELEGPAGGENEKGKDVDELGEAMDRAFGRSEMG